MKIQTVNVTGQVVDYMRDCILSGSWKEGEKIPSENQLVEELGVSRTSIRSAVQYLAGLGIVRSHQGKGTILIDSRAELWDGAESKITSDDCRDIYKVLEFRRMLEPQVCRLAVTHADDACLKILEECTDQMKQFHDRSDKGRFVAADMQFHETICRCSGNPLAWKSLHRVFQETERNHEQMFEVFGHENGIFYHTAILEAFRDRDVSRACSLMEQHIQSAMDVLQSMI